MRQNICWISNTSISNRINLYSYVKIKYGEGYSKYFRAGKSKPGINM